MTWGEYVSVKVRRDVKNALTAYARARGVSLSAAIADLLEKTRLAYWLERITCLLEEQNALLKEILEALEKSKPAFPEPKPLEKPARDETLPTFMQNNPWLSVLSMRGREP